MAREITPEQRARMDEGRKRREAEDARQRADRQGAYSAWVAEDGRLWRAYCASASPEVEAETRAAWRANLAKMPELP